MFEQSGRKERAIKIGLLGASFDTGNLGVSALAESSIKIILNKWPNAEIVLLGSGYEPHQHRLSIAGKEIYVRTLPIRFSKNIFLPYHFLWLILYGLIARAFPRSRLKDVLVNRNSCFRLLYETDVVADITAGDSFSDIYGMHKFIIGFFLKWLVIQYGKELVLLPQTYGPFKRTVTKMMARHIMNRVGLVYARDLQGVEYVKNLLGNHTKSGKVKFAPDVAFVLDSRKPDEFDASPLSKIPKDSTLVGLNVSGLLFSGGYARDNEFGLKTDYRILIQDIVRMLLEDKNVVVLLIPHVFPPANYEVESDPIACLKVYEQLKGKYAGRIFLVEGEYNQGEIKYIIGLCDFFIGSRMHSCIAALSQCIPAVGIAYSKKFHGVFESIGLTECVADARSLEKEQILKIVESVFRERNKTRRHLEGTIPGAKKDVLNIF